MCVLSLINRQQTQVSAPPPVIPPPQSVVPPQVAVAPPPPVPPPVVPTQPPNHNGDYLNNAMQRAINQGKISKLLLVLNLNIYALEQFQ